MKAARYFGNSDVRVEDIAEPTVAPGQVGIDVAWCGICATDLREFVDGPWLVPGPGHPNPITGETLPVVIGHEISGVVYEIGEGVTKVAVGDHVVVEPIILPDSVGVGPEDHQYNIHPDITWNGMNGGSGGLSEKMVVGERWAHKIDKSIPLDAAALMEPLSTSIHAVRISRIEPGATALVTGAGPLGLLVANVLTAKGVKVFVSEPLAMRRQLAKEIAKADQVLDPTAQDVVAEVNQLTDGQGVDVVFECSGNRVALNQGLSALKLQGVMVVVSFWVGLVPVDLTTVLEKELTIRGAVIYNNDHSTTVSMVEDGKFDLASYVTHRIGIDDLVSFGYDTLINRNETAVKILVSPSGRGL